jgi:G3E family GTPase
VTDPDGVIRALDERFGKMTRARLDTVVTVVDADAFELLEEEGGGEGQGVALARQLACADVVLLNKADLLTEERCVHCCCGCCGAVSKH